MWRVGGWAFVRVGRQVGLVSVSVVVTLVVRGSRSNRLRSPRRTCCTEAPHEPKRPAPREQPVRTEALQACTRGLATRGYVLAGLEVIGVLGVGYGELVDVHGADRYLLRVRALREPAKAQANKQEPFSPK